MKKTKSRTAPGFPNKHLLYEHSVQSPGWHTDWFVEVYRELRGRFPRHLREDFCGTFRLAREWVNRNQHNTAVGIDLDASVLAYGRKHHLPSLTRGQRARIQMKKGDVLDVTSRRFDLIIACNFSFYTFHDRDTLVRYLRGCLRSLAPDGLLILEMAGGPGMIEQTKERKTFRVPGLRGRFRYIWDQQSFDPISHRARYTISFRNEKGDWLRDAFIYEWRIWTLPEVRDAMNEAGFPDSCVYWETEHKGEGTGEYARTEKGDNAYSWIGYAVGKAPARRASKSAR